MYESGVSKVARILVVLLAILLGIIFIMTSGCSCANAAEQQEVIIESLSGAEHLFF